jgi:hypothetical protein
MQRLYGVFWCGGPRHCVLCYWAALPQRSHSAVVAVPVDIIVLSFVRLLHPLPFILPPPISLILFLHSFFFLSSVYPTYPPKLLLLLLFLSFFLTLSSPSLFRELCLGYEHDYWTEARLPSGTEIFLSWSAYTGYGACCAMGTGSLCLAIKRLVQERGVLPPLAVRLHGVVLSSTHG